MKIETSSVYCWFCSEPIIANRWVTATLNHKWQNFYCRAYERTLHTKCYSTFWAGGGIKPGSKVERYQIWRCRPEAIWNGVTLP